jgi:predicted Fe-S protein YdhL (DUF1289 family)
MRSRRPIEDDPVTHWAIRSAPIIVAVLLVGVEASAAGPVVAQNWQEMTPKERSEALQNYQQHEQLPEERRREVERGYERWQGMSPDERNHIRQNYERFRQLPPNERERFQRKYEKWKQREAPQH